MIEVFDVEDGIVRVNANCLLIPELKKVIEYYQDPIPALAYVYYMTAPDSPYANMPEHEKQEMISDDMGGTFKLEDEVLLMAIDKMNRLFETPTARYYNAIKRSLDMTSEELNKVTTLSFDRNTGNAEMLDRMQLNAGKKIEAFKKLEKIRDEEIKTALRGKAQSGMY
jgi:hypothetical protein